MYSYEDRLRAVRLYVKLGKRVGLTIRQLGYPTENALKGWYRPARPSAFSRSSALTRSTVE
jgi:transposase-like protein